MLSSPSPSSSSSSPSTSKTRNPRPETQTQSKWKAPSQQRLYNKRLLDALRNPNQPTGSARAIKDAADSALALTARGQSRWSQAILTKRVQLRAGAKVRRKKPKKPAKLMKPAVAAGGELDKEGKVEERLRRLGRLVPGCKKLPTTSLLEEAADYVAALEVQVKAMRALAEAMAAAAISAGPTDQAEEASGR